MPDRTEPPTVSAIRVARLPRDGEEIMFRAGEAERRALAERLGVLSIDRFEARVVAAPWRRDGVSVRGTLTATVVQESVVTLEPVTQRLDERVDLTFVPEGSPLAKPLRDEPAELELDPEGDDPPDVFTGDAIDLAEALAEILALGLDPYPRGGEDSFESTEPDAALEPSGKVSPFAALAALKGGPTGG